MRRRPFFVGLISVLGMLLPIISVVAAPADFYKGKTITLVVGYGPGGGYDTRARLIGPEIEKRTEATVVVKNIPGGGGVVALNQMARGKPDGLTLMLVNGQAAALGQLLSQPGVRYDLLDLPTIGLVSPEPSVMLVRKEGRLKTIKYLLTPQGPIKWSAGGKVDGIADVAACFSEALQLNSKIIIGYKGSSESALAVMRGETDAIMVSASSGKKYTKGGALVPLTLLARQRSPLLPDVPTIFETTDLTEEQAWWIDFRDAVSGIGRYLITTPGTPQDRVDYLAAIVKDILTDPAFVENARSKKAVFSYASPGQTNRLIEKTLKLLSPKQRDRVRFVILEKYY